jgi:type I restriction enzyme, S subunit
MSKAWTKVRLGEVLERSEETVEPVVDAEYREITVRLWGKGVIERGLVNGSELSGRRFIARVGQFIASRIDARNGAMGLVPPMLDGALVTNDFPLFWLNCDRLDPSFLAWLCRTEGFVELCQRASEGTTNRVRLQEDRFLAFEIPIPPLAEQRRIAAQIAEFASHVHDARTLRKTVVEEIKNMLIGAFRQIAKTASRRAMREVAPLVRRPVEVDQTTLYPELGIRSFGNGTFHKPELSGLELGGKRIFKIEPGDLVFSNVFAWEGAIAVAKPEDAGRFGSHRFITCVAKPGEVTARFLCFYFLTKEGLELIQIASPGGAGRNRTLGLEALANIEVPVPSYTLQVWFDSLQAEVERLKRLQAATAAELDALLPAIVDKAFKGEM